RRNLALVEEFRRFDVRSDHAFLDQLVRIVARLGAELHNGTGFVETEFHLTTVEIDGAAALPRLGQYPIQLMQVFQLRQYVGEFRTRGCVLLAQRLPYAC